MTLPDRRWYVAWHPERPVGVLRAKDAAGLEEWRERKWRAFPSTPTIVDVTDSMGPLLALFALPRGGANKVPLPAHGPLVTVLTYQADDAAVQIRPWASPPLEGEVAGMAVDIIDGVGDLIAIGRLVSRVMARHSRFRAPAALERGIAGTTFPAGTRLARVQLLPDGTPDRFPVEEIGTRRDWPRRSGSRALWPADDADPAWSIMCSCNTGPASDWPALWAEEDATEPGQLVRVRQTVEQRTGGS